MNNTIILEHITDVGSSTGNGCDSTRRIQQQYNQLGLTAQITSAGHSPLHVAFTACTTLSSQASDNVNKLLQTLQKKVNNHQPVALNCAPRNNSKQHINGKEDYIYRIQFKGQGVFLIYGPEVLQWVLEFHDKNEATVEKIIAINDLIPDTSSGSQFRSAEHLPIAHFLEQEWLLEQHSQREAIDVDKIPSVFPEPTKTVVVAPPDEYNNGRLIIHQDLFSKVIQQKQVQIPTITDQKLAVKQSLTEVVPGELSIWPSSNHFPNKDITVLNIGTRWQTDTTCTTDNKVIALSEKLTQNVGSVGEVFL